MTDQRLIDITRGTTTRPEKCELLAELGNLVLVKHPGGIGGSTLYGRGWVAGDVRVHRVIAHKPYDGRYNSGTIVWDNDTDGRLTAKRKAALVDRFLTGKLQQPKEGRP